MKQVVIVIGLVALTWVSSAKADVTVNTRFGGTPATKVGIGVSNNRVYIVEQHPEGTCRDQIISSQSGLTDNVTFNAGGGSNRVRVAIGGWDVRLCGFTLTNLRSNFKLLKINGGGGDDVIIVERASNADGGSGNDAIIAYDTFKYPAGFGQMWGGSGNDVIIQTQSNSGRLDQLNGGDGDDYICELGDGSEIFMGVGHDRFFNTGNGLNHDIERFDAVQVNRSDCEATWQILVFSFPF